MRKGVVAAVTASLIIGGGGIAAAADQSSLLPGETECVPQAEPSLLSGAQAADKVLRAAGGGRVTGVQLTEQNGRPMWTVTVQTGNGTGAASVDGFTGAVSPGAAPGTGTNTGATGNSGAVADTGATGDGTSTGGGTSTGRGDDDGDGEDGNDNGNAGNSGNAGNTGGAPVRRGVTPSK